MKNLLPLCLCILFGSCNYLNSDLEVRVSNIEEIISSKHSSYIQTTNNLNIRRSNSVKSEVLAVASSNSLFRILSEDTKSGMLMVEFYINKFPFTGYVSNNKNFSNRVSYNLIDELSVMKSGHIQFAWENIITKKIQKENYSSLAFNISHEDNSIKSILSNTVINLMVENNIRVKEIGKVDISDITNVCFNNEVETILSVDVSNETIQIKLFDKNSSILVSYLLPYSSSVFSIN